MLTRFVVVAALIGSSAAQASDPLVPVVNPPPLVSNAPPMLVPPTPVPPSEPSPVPSGEWFFSERNKAPIFGMDLLLGQQLGIRPNVTLYSTEKSTLVAEGFYGALLTKFGTSEGAGAGLRCLICRGGDDSVTFGPGLDVMFNFGDGKATFLAPTVDFAWQHRFGERASFLLGLNAGVGIGISNDANDQFFYFGSQHDGISGKVTPLISFFTGLRF